MKKKIYPTSLPLLTLAAGVIGLLLRLWLLSGVGEDRLLKAWHPAAILAALLSAGVLVCLILFAQPLKGQGKYRTNFPASIPGAVCACAAGLAIFLRGMGILLDAQTPVATVAGIACVLAAPCLILTGMCRWKGEKPSFLLHTVLSLCLACQILLHYQTWTASPNLQLHLYRMLANVGLMLTAYHRAEFDVRMASRRVYTVINLYTVFCCLLAVPEGDGLYFLAMAAWVLTNQCALTVFRRRPAALPKEESEEEAPEESLPEEKAPEAPAPEDPGQEDA